MNFSIVVATYGRFEAFKKLVNSIENTVIEGDSIQLIVVSSDHPESDKIQWIKRLSHFDVNLHLDDVRVGPRTKSLYYFENIGIKVAKHEWVIVCNDDMWFDPNWIVEFKKVVSKVNVYIISTHLGDPNFGLRIPLVGSFKKGLKTFPLWLMDMTIIHKSIYEQIDFLDEHLKWFGKGADLALKIAFLTNEKVKLAHSVIVNHDMSPSERVANISQPSTRRAQEDFHYISSKWNSWILDNNLPYKFDF